jgi:hypothetical protein
MKYVQQPVVNHDSNNKVWIRCCMSRNIYLIKINVYLFCHFQIEIWFVI